MSTTQLLRQTQQAFHRPSGSREHVARVLGVDRARASRALCDAGLEHAPVWARILSLLEEVPVHRRSTYDGAHAEHRWVLADG